MNKLNRVVGKRGSRKPNRDQASKGGEPNWRKVLGAELYARAEFIRERDGTEVVESVVLAMQHCDMEETRALFVRYGSTEAVLRMLVADWLKDHEAEQAGDPAKTPPKRPLMSLGMERDLVDQVRGLDAHGRLGLAAKLERWARQLRFSVAIETPTRDIFCAIPQDSLRAEMLKHEIEEGLKGPPPSLRIGVAVLQN
jgi:hypothetical protein